MRNNDNCGFRISERGLTHKSESKIQNPKFAILVIVGIYLLCILIANPRGEFPLNDDWSYARTAFSIGSGHGAKVDPWPAPSLVGQALYGGLLVKIFSARFLVLRISTLCLSCGTVVLLWGILRRIGFCNRLACIMLLGWIFNPLQFSLSFTYMTEVPFIFFITLALFLYSLHVDSGRFAPLILSAAALGYAYLVRQSALIFIVALVCSLLLDGCKNKRDRLQQAILVCSTAGLFIASYYIWVVTHGGATAAVHRKLQLLEHLTAKQIIGNSLGMLFYLVFMTAPLLILLIPALYRMIRHFRLVMRLGIPAAWCAIAVMGIWWFHAQYRPAEYLPSAAYHAKMPFLLNVLYDTGLGPLTLEPDYYSSPATPTYPGAWQAITWLVAIGVIVAGSFCMFGLIRIRMNPIDPKRRPLLLFISLSSLFLAVFEIIFSHLQEGGLFDRHILIVSFPFSILLGIIFSDHDRDSSLRIKRGILVPAGIAIAALIAFSVAATHDYMEWNRVRWEMGRSLLDRGVDPLSIVGGFEFNAWNNYDTFTARGNVANIHYWWYDKRDYIISMTPQEEYQILQSRKYFSWVHRRPIALYLLTAIHTKDTK
jgi:hypothetical protein